jgi:hypothetical protein
MQMVLKDRSDVLIWENVVLIQALTPNDAYDKADAFGSLGEGNSDGTLEWGRIPACMVYPGTRRLVILSSLKDIHNSPTDECEVTYMRLTLDSEEALALFMNGEGAAQLLE